MMRVNYSRFAKAPTPVWASRFPTDCISGFAKQLTNKMILIFSGMDLKFKLFEERAYRPEISVGLQSVLGHKRMAGISCLVQRYRILIFTLGLGWGRMGTRQLFPILACQILLFCQAQTGWRKSEPAFRLVYRRCRTVRGINMIFLQLTGYRSRPIGAVITGRPNNQHRLLSTPCSLEYRPILSSL